MSDTTTSRTSCASGAATRRPGLCERLVLGLLERFDRGELCLYLPDGSLRRFGGSIGETRAELHVKNARFFRRLVLHGDVGFGEAYVDGDWESPDISAVIAWMLENTPAREAAERRPLYNAARRLNRLAHLLRPNSRNGSRKNIAAHYDLGNDFYETFLDETWTYSGAFYQRANISLEEAQEAKYARLARALDLRAGHRVLEIGCGWGGFALHAAREHGCHVTAVTLSCAQHELATARVKEAGLEGQVEVLLCDYRELTGTYDRIASIEMVEAVGHRFLPGYFARLQALLAPGGAAGLQAIVYPDHDYRNYSRGIDFIQKHVFPGGHLPSLGALQRAAEKAGRLQLVHLEAFGRHYARTLRDWRERFEGAWESVRAQGFDENFRRKWRYYLAYCEGAFARRNIELMQLVYTRPLDTAYAPPGLRA